MTKKKTKKAEKKCKTYSDEMELTPDMVTNNEIKVAKALNGKGQGTRVKMTLQEIANKTGWKKSLGVKKSNSTVRNSIRRLVRGGWAEWVDRGVYRISQSGRNATKKIKVPKKKATKKIVVKKAPAKKKTAKKAKSKKGNSAPPPKSIIPASARARV
jgi:hypothetical protein